MARNRKISKKLSANASNTMRIGGVIMAVVLVAVLNVLSASSCDQLVNEKGSKERELAKLEESYCRQSTRWEEMKTPEKLERALFKHGLKMSVPRADQCIRLRDDGAPYPNQLALTRLRQRSATTVTAKYAPSAAAPRASAKRKLR